MAREQSFTNARIVLPDEILTGSVLVRDGLIADISAGPARQGEDCEGDYLIPGLVELHTDHLETHYAPRPGLRWMKMAAIQAHDAQIVTSGITTVFDCLRMGSAEGDDGFATGEMRDMADALAAAEQENRLRADHRIHLRCEVSTDNVLDQFEAFRNDPKVGLVSLMDHAPGQRQFQTMDQYIFYYKTKRGLSDEAFAIYVEKQLALSERNSARHRVELSRICAARGIPIASHDDATAAHVEESIGLGVKLAEFPTSLEAADLSHQAGLSVLMGAPNVVRGGSHSGNIAACDLAERGVLDVLSSDYVPFSLIHAPFLLADAIEGFELEKAIALVSDTPARTVGLNDRGRIALGYRGDLVRVERKSSVPIVRSVWREGRRVA
jgi:alpha-D-ribose 1-methylphosphonate 5-triphosphate diphosphatase